MDEEENLFEENDLESEFGEEQTRPFTSNHVSQNRFFNISHNSINQNKFDNYNKNTANDRILKNNIGKQAKANPPKMNSANSKVTKNSVSKGSNSKINAAKNIINSIQKNKSQAQNSLNKNESAKKEETTSDKNTTKGSIGQLSQGVGNFAKNVASRVIASRTGVSPNNVGKMLEVAGAGRKKMIIGLVLCSLLFVFVFVVCVFADDGGANSGSSGSSASYSNYYSGNLSEEELINILADIGVIDYGYCYDDTGVFDESCDFISFIKKIKENTATEDEFLYVLYAISYERSIEDYIDNNEELDELLNNSSNLQTYLNGDYLSKYRSDLPVTFDLYAAIGQEIYDNSSSDEFEIDSETGFVMRIKRAQRDNTFYYSSANAEYNISLEGECVWYAEGRADEILANWGINMKYGALGNGGQFCTIAKAYGYNINLNINDIEEGSIISWMYGSFGHVAIVEKVNKDSSGNVTSIIISQGGLGYYNPNGANSFQYNGQTILTSTFIGNNWGFVNNSSYGGTVAQRRQSWCEAFDTGCQNFGQILYGNSIKTFGRSDTNSWCTIPLSQFK